VLECVINISEGRDVELIAAIGAAAGPDLLDVHSDPHHHRSVLTVVGEPAARAVATAAVAGIDLSQHAGVHPRVGAVDVVPFVPLAGSRPAAALAARDRFARWFADEHGVPCFLYGPERSLPDVRRRVLAGEAPDVGSLPGDPRAGCCAVGARDVLVAYNVWLAEPDLALARAVATAVRGDGIRSLGLLVGDRAQVSMNLIEPHRVGPADAFDRVMAAAAEHRAAVQGAELVGLVPEAVLRSVDAARWPELDLAPDRTIEARLRMRR
jgi:glutamate formiminotransferase